jgi:hypothetical protein
MPEAVRFRGEGKFVRVLLIANLCLWVYFWLAFAKASQPYDPRPWGHFPIDLYSFWGHAIGLTKSSFAYPFVEAIFWVEFPSFLFVTLVQHAFFAKVSADQFFAGISVGGYKLLAIMLLSFLQWYFVGWLGQKLWQKWFRHSPGGLNQAAASNPMPPGASTSRP